MVGVGPGLMTFTPAFDPAATGSLQVELTRNPRKFKLLRYIKLIPVSVMAGFYLRTDPRSGNRVVTPQDQAWPLGNPRPRGRRLDIEFPQYQTQRFTESFDIPVEVAAQAKFDVKAMYARNSASLMNVGRTRRAWARLNDTSLYTSGTNLFANTNALVGSALPWDSQTADTSNIQFGVQTALQKIQLNSASVVEAKDIIMVFNPRTALKMSRSWEMRSYVKANEQALRFLESSDAWREWNIPKGLFGVGDVVIEDASYTSTRKGATTQTTDYIVPDNVVMFMSRPEGLMGAEGVPTFASASCFAYEDMTVEVGDPNGEMATRDRVVWGGVTDNSGFELTAPATLLRMTTVFT